MPLASFLLSLIKPAVYQILIYLGISIVSWVGVSASVDSYLNDAKTLYMSADPEILQYLSIAGVPDFLGAIAAGITFRVSQYAAKKLRFK